MKRPHKKVLLLLNLSLMALFLTGCPIPATNKPQARSSKNMVLPYAAKSDQALVYIVQPYAIIDWYLVGGAASDGDRYSSSVYLKSTTTGYAYIGKLDARNNLCFYSKPGQYFIQFKNVDSTPATIEQPLKLQANSTRILALERSSYSGGTSNTLQFKELSLAEGKGYINADNTTGCASVGTVATSAERDVTMAYSLTFKNETANVWGISSTARTMPVAKLIQPGDSYTYESKKFTVSNEEFMKSGLSVFNSSLRLRKIESADKMFPTDEETILNNPIHENAYTYINIELPQNKFYVHAYFNGIFPKFQADSTCQLVKPMPDARVNCVVELRDKVSAKK